MDPIATAKFASAKYLYHAVKFSRRSANAPYANESTAAANPSPIADATDAATAKPTEATTAEATDEAKAEATKAESAKDTEAATTATRGATTPTDGATTEATESSEATEPATTSNANNERVYVETTSSCVANIGTDFCTQQQSAIITNKPSFTAIPVRPQHVVAAQ